MSNTMATRTHTIVSLIDFICANTKIKFRNREAFLLKLLTIDRTEAMTLASRIYYAAAKVEPHRSIVITDFRDLSRTVKLRGREKKWRWVVEHEFKCCFCKRIVIEETNSFGLADPYFRTICEECLDRSAN